MQSATENASLCALVAGTLDLVPLPQAYMRIRELVDDPDATLADVTDVVSADPALAARLLRLANSAYLGLVNPVESLDHAVRVLGMNEIHDMALATSAVGSLSKLRTDLFDIFDFWKVSIYCAVCARNVALAAKLPAPQRLFVAGLMHSVGSLILAHEMPAAVAQCRERARALERPYHELEREAFGFDYADVGGELMAQWQLPETLVGPVRLHTRAIENLDDAGKPSAAVLQIAATTARAAAWQSAESEPVPAYDEGAIDLCGLGPELIEEIMTQVDDEVVDACAILMPDA